MLPWRLLYLSIVCAAGLDEVASESEGASSKLLRRYSAHKSKKHHRGHGHHPRPAEQNGSHASPGVLNTVHSFEIPLVVFVQQHTPAFLNKSLELYGRELHPSSNDAVVLPLLCALGFPGLGMQMIVVASTSDLAALALKSVLAADRPYWTSNAVIRSPGTCESGFGMPSAHSVNFAAAWYFILFSVGASRWAYQVVTALAILVAFSRVYFGNHFPTQTAGGLLLGMLVAHLGCSTFRIPRIREFFGKAEQDSSRSVALASYAYLCLALVAVLICAAHAWGHLVNPDELAAIACHKPASKSRLPKDVESMAIDGGLLLGVAAMAWFIPFGNDAPLRPLRNLSVKRWMNALCLLGCYFLLGLVLELAIRDQHDWGEHGFGSGIAMLVFGCGFKRVFKVILMVPLSAAASHLNNEDAEEKPLAGQKP